MLLPIDLVEVIDRPCRGDPVADGQGPAVRPTEPKSDTCSVKRLPFPCGRRLRAWRVTPRSFAASTMLPAPSSANTPISINQLMSGI